MLHALKDYAEANGIDAEPGFKSKEVKWLILFDFDGNYGGIRRIGEGKSGQLIHRCPHLTQPELKSGGAGCRHFLVDGLDVISLRTTKGDPDAKLQQKHRFFLEMLSLAASAEPSLGPIAKSLADEECVEKINSDLDGFTPKAKPNDLATFVLSGDEQQIIVNLESWLDWWRDFRKSLAKDNKKKKSESRLCFLQVLQKLPAVQGFVLLDD